MDGLSRRAFVPVETVENGQCSTVILKAGIPYGVPWVQFLGPSPITSEAITNALHRAGIWTYEDLQSNDRRIIKIATDLVGAAIWAAAKKACKRK